VRRAQTNEGSRQVVGNGRRIDGHDPQRTRQAVVTVSGQPTARTAATAAFLLVTGLPGAFAAASAAWAAPQPAPQPAAQDRTAPEAETPAPWRLPRTAAAPTVAEPAPVAAPARRPAAPHVSPLVRRIHREAAGVEMLTEQLVEEREALRQLTAASEAGEAAWAAASEQYLAVRQRLEAWTRDSYAAYVAGGSAEPGPVTELTHQHTPGGTDEGSRLGAELAAATEAVGRTGDEYAARHRAVAWITATVRELGAEHGQRTTALERLQARHRSELAAARTITDRFNAALSRRYLGTATLAPGEAGRVVARMLRFALAQVGKPYVWGAEGPDSYDCSGLVQTSYATAGVGLPRTARPQYLATVPVPLRSLLPGDLLFFGPDRSNWNSIHHVAIYLGDGRMLHAPTPGDVVRIAPIWWAEFFGATRVVDANGAAGRPGIPAPARPAPGPSPDPSRPAPPPAPAPRPSPTDRPPARDDRPREPSPGARPGLVDPTCPTRLPLPLPSGLLDALTTGATPPAPACIPTALPDCRPGAFLVLVPRRLAVEVGPLGRITGELCRP
jgi:cell wall-associated NlpC family hydrolase